MKHSKTKCPLNPPNSKEPCPLEPSQDAQRGPSPGSIVVSRTEKKSWLTLAITGFGALLLRYLKTVRERAWKVRATEKKGHGRRREH